MRPSARPGRRRAGARAPPAGAGPGSTNLRDDAIDQLTFERPETVAVVVTFQPEIGRLREVLGALAAQAQAVVLVDNASDADLSEVLERCCPTTRTALVRLAANRGVAFAQNVGIERARELGASFVLLMDQDSLPGPGMVDALLRAAAGRDAVAAVGPLYVDEQSGRAARFVRVRGLRHRPVSRPEDGAAAEVDFLISSGSLIPLPALDRVGPMREDLFIDYVDVEWCLRARSRGLTCLGAFDATMSHRLGEGRGKVFGRGFVVRTPLRHYYLMRNALLLYREPWVPLGFKLADAARLALKFALYALAAPPRMAHLRMMGRGLWHGLTGRTGALA